MTESTELNQVDARAVLDEVCKHSRAVRYVVEFAKAKVATMESPQRGLLDVPIEKACELCRLIGKHATGCLHSLNFPN